MDIRIWRITIPVGTVFRILFRFLDLVFFDDFLFLDHAASAVFTIVFSFFTRSSAAGAVVVVFDLCPCDLFFCRLGGSETLAAGEP